MRHSEKGSVRLTVGVGGDNGSGYANADTTLAKHRTAIDRLGAWYEQQLQATDTLALTA